MPGKQKLFCYVDETGQDPISEFFIVVAIVSDQDQAALRESLVAVESIAGTGQLKWHKSRHKRRMNYLQTVLQMRIGFGDVFFCKYKKPLPYFFSVLETLKRAITSKADRDYRVTIFIDGIDKKKAAELTNALRFSNIKLDMVRSRRDESEPLIRLADMWAGCIRDAILGGIEARALFGRGVQLGYLVEITQN